LKNRSHRAKIIILSRNSKQFFSNSDFKQKTTQLLKSTLFLRSIFPIFSKISIAQLPHKRRCALVQHSCVQPVACESRRFVRPTLFFCCSIRTNWEPVLILIILKLTLLM